MKSAPLLLSLLVASALATRESHGQTQPHPVYLDTTVATIRILIDPDSLAQILDPANAQSDHEYPATFMFENPLIRDTLENIGFRLRGNTSRVSRKKSFKISFNTFERGREFHGLEKLNVNGEHNDPSIIRAKLSWDLFVKSGVPASLASHTRLYINGMYFGLYISVEHVDENFVQSRFGNNNGNLYKCLWPADLQYLGSNPDLYKLSSGNRRVYELTINEEIDDYADLAHFISVLNLTPHDTFALAIQRVFNVNSFLKTLAMDVAVGSWDDYWFLKNNYYLYHNQQTDKFEFIPYDYDNTFGIWWTQIYPNLDFGVRNVYTWGHPTEPRPLTTRMLEVTAFKNRFSFYLNRLLQRHFREAALYPRIDSIHAMITPAAEADSFRTLDYGYTIQQFHNSYTQALGNHVTYGLKPYIVSRRYSALGQLQNVNVPPILSELTHEPRHPFAGDPVTVTVLAEDEQPAQSVLLMLRVNGAQQSPVTMFDDGLHNDGAAGDEVYGAILPAFSAGALVEYYVRATDVTAQISSEPPDAPESMNSFRVLGVKPRLFINEFMAANVNTIRDPFNDADDWIEIYNADSVAVSLENCYLSDNFGNPMKWRFPDTAMAPGTFLIVWADDQPAQGPLHATFKLDRDGERIGLYRGDSTALAILDTITFGYQQTDVSYGRTPDGGVWQPMQQPTPGASNNTTEVGESLEVPASFTLHAAYPNPFNPATTIGFEVAETGDVLIRIFDILGREVAVVVNELLPAGKHSIVWNASGHSSGVYFIRMQSGRFVGTTKVVLMR